MAAAAEVGEVVEEEVAAKVLGMVVEAMLYNVVKKPLNAIMQYGTIRYETTQCDTIHFGKKRTQPERIMNN